MTKKSFINDLYWYSRSEDDFIESWSMTGCPTRREWGSLNLYWLVHWGWNFPHSLRVQLDEEFSDWIQIQNPKPILFTKEIWIFKTTPILCSEKKTGAHKKKDEAKPLPKRCQKRGNVFFWENGRVVQVVRACDGKVETSKSDKWKKGSLIWVSTQKLGVVKPPQIIHLNRLFHYFSPSILGFFPLFL